MSNLKRKRFLAPILGLLIILSAPLYLTPAVYGKGSSYSVTTIPVGPAPVFEAYDPANGNLYVGNSVSNTVSVISSSTNNVIATTVVGSNPAHLTWDPVNSNVYVSNH